MALLALTLYFLLMLGIGLHAWRNNEKGRHGFLLGGRKLGPAVTALSAGASDMSAWLLMGLPGAMVATGLVSSWIAIGLFLGAWCNYRLVAPRLRIYTELAGDAVTLSEYLENRFSDSRHILRISSSLVFIVFFTLYTSSGLVAGGVLLESYFGMQYVTGTILTASIVVIYSLMGGFRAVCNTDFVQGSIMLVALIMVPLITISLASGTEQSRDYVIDQVPLFFDWMPQAGILGIISSMAWGLGYFGQPHIIVRFMALRDVRDFKLARRIGLSWMGIALLGALLTGFSGITYLYEQGVNLDNPETVFILLSDVLFHPFISGLLMAAILAAIMSTISSQLLVSASSLGEDCYAFLFPGKNHDTDVVSSSRVALVVVALVALWLASNPDNTILSLVGNAWAGLGASFGPVILFSLFWKDMNWQGALAGMLAGAVTVILWIYLPVTIAGQGLQDWMYELLPGFAVACLAVYCTSRLSGGADGNIQSSFTEMLKKVASAG